MGFSDASDGKEYACNAGDQGSIPDWEDPLKNPLEWQFTPVLWPGEFHGQRSQVGYSPWGHKESDMTE